MKNILMVLFVGSLLCIQGVKAQSTVQLYNEAYGDYENGNYESGLSKLSRLETELGSTNAKIQSLKTLLYSEQGDTRNALLSAEKYFKTNPDARSEGYASMRSIYEELKAGMTSEYAAKKKNIENLRNQELANVEKQKMAEIDLNNFLIARKAGTIAALEVFLQKNSTKSLADSANILIKQIALEQKRESLISEGLELMSKGATREAVSKMQLAQDIRYSASLKATMADVTAFARRQAISAGDAAMLSESWAKAVDEYKYALGIGADDPLQKKYREAVEEFEFATAIETKNVSLVKNYISTYPNGRKSPQGR